MWLGWPHSSRCLLPYAPFALLLADRSVRGRKSGPIGWSFVVSLYQLNWVGCIPRPRNRLYSIWNSWQVWAGGGGRGVREKCWAGENTGYMVFVILGPRHNTQKPPSCGWGVPSDCVIYISLFGLGIMVSREF